MVLSLSSCLVALGASALYAQAATTPAPAAQPSAPANSALPLTDYHFTYPNLPFKVNPFPVGRGPQSGYNICNSTTEGSKSQCQTLFVNSIDDFCLWGSPIKDGQIGDVEAATVAYCSKPGHGTRVMPAGTLTAVQFLKAPGYIQVTGRMNQQGIGLLTNDTGGELDPHGADLAGNPLGGLVFSNNLPTSKDNSFIQVTSWSNYVGSGVFCMKACDPTINSPNYCENIFDLLGCSYNMPAAYAPGVFLSCESDNQLPPGQYVVNGVTSTFKQTSPLPTPMPYQPVIPATSSCTTYTSSLLYSGAPATTFTTASTGTATAAKTPVATVTGASPKGTTTGTSSSSAASSVTFALQSGMIGVSTALVISLVAGLRLML